MNKSKLLEVRDQYFWKFSDEAREALVNMIDYAIDEGGFEDFYDAFHETVDDTFIYYDTAWDYMKNYGDNDLADAVNAGFTNICAVAWYNLGNEFHDLMREAGLTTEDFEVGDTKENNEDDTDE